MKRTETREITVVLSKDDIDIMTELRADLQRIADEYDFNGIDKSHITSAVKMIDLQLGSIEL